MSLCKSGQEQYLEASMVVIASVLHLLDIPHQRQWKILMDTWFDKNSLWDGDSIESFLIYQPCSKLHPIGSLSIMISIDLDPSLYGYRWRELKLKTTIICSKPPATSQSQIPKLLGCAVLTLSCHHSTLEDQRIDDGLPWKIVGSTQNVLSLEKDIRTSIYHG